MGALFTINKVRMIFYAAVALLHGLLLYFMAFKMDTLAVAPEPPAQVMKLVDVLEDIPPPPPPPPPPKPAEPQQNAVEAVAENMIETDEVPKNQVVVDTLPQKPQAAVEYRQVDYLPQNKVSKTPRFSDQDIRKIANYLREQYPPIALRSGLAGNVYLELFIDSKGIIRQINILKESPEGRGFGEVAVNAFKDIQASPAEANGAAVAVRYRYPIRFTVK
ncbi:MAG: energy transducer TonB [Spirochaetaceae bacterium]|jgi:protein TonB|nr:energy transducer TonB [Spirochaetaceae bacterium]